MSSVYVEHWRPREGFGDRSQGRRTFERATTGAFKDMVRFIHPNVRLEQQFSTDYELGSLTSKILGKSFVGAATCLSPSLVNPRLSYHAASKDHS